MWWGPGSQNSLLMSNNAPGFLHLTLNTRYPIKTGIGNFEFQFISGKLTEDTSVLLENKDLTTYYYNQGTYDGGPADPKTDSLNWRYI
ncbi:capsule assembly Wzi family protein, partial [Acinetobacter baumannii]